MDIEHGGRFKHDPGHSWHGKVSRKKDMREHINSFNIHVRRYITCMHVHVSHMHTVCV